MLFRLNIIRAVVVDIPMDAKYGEEQSNLKISKIVAEFAFKHFRNFVKRIIYSYYLRDLSLASFELPLGLALMLGGAIFGVSRWVAGAHIGATATAGTVMLAALPFLAGLQLILAFLGYDISSAPSRPIHKSLRRAKLLTLKLVELAVRIIAALRHHSRSATTAIPNSNWVGLQTRQASSAS